VGDGSEKARLDLGRIVDAGRNAVRQQVEQERLLAGRRALMSSISSAVCLASSGSGGMPSAARSAACWRYACSMVSP
jgi:hypothetical protein